jgi:hypothetical protein
MEAVCVRGEGAGVDTVGIVSEARCVRSKALPLIGTSSGAGARSRPRLSIFTWSFAARRAAAVMPCLRAMLSSDSPRRAL